MECAARSAVESLLRPSPYPAFVKVSLRGLGPRRPVGLGRSVPADFERPEAGCGVAALLLAAARDMALRGICWGSTAAAGVASAAAVAQSSLTSSRGGGGSAAGRNLVRWALLAPLAPLARFGLLTGT